MTRGDDAPGDALVGLLLIGAQRDVTPGVWLDRRPEQPHVLVPGQAHHADQTRDRADELGAVDPMLLLPETPRTPVDLPVRRRSWSSMISRWR
jgi:hypothetical protein